MTLSKKIVLIGHFGVGKSSLIRRLVEDTFSENYKVSIGVHISKNKIEVAPSNNVSLVIWDIEGHDVIEKTRNSYLLGTNGFIYVYDLSRSDTFENLDSELTFLKKNYPNIPIKVVGNKMDLVTKSYLKHHSGVFGHLVDYFTSAKTGSRVGKLFSKLAEDLL